MYVIKYKANKGIVIVLFVVVTFDGYKIIETI